MVWRWREQADLFSATDHQESGAFFALCMALLKLIGPANNRGVVQD